MPKKDLAIVLAWPDQWTTQTSSAYDRYAHILGIAKDGKYKVGHAAMVLIKQSTGELEYFDFGRYVASLGNGRIRDKITDPDVSLQTRATFENGKLSNIEEILLELKGMESTHGTGKMLAGVFEGIDFEKSYNFAKNWQKEGMIPYGPFDLKGSNCSRFVAKVIRKGRPIWYLTLLLKFPYTISPSPKFNIRLGRSQRHYYRVTESGIYIVKPNIFKKIK